MEEKAEIYEYYDLFPGSIACDFVLVDTEERWCPNKSIKLQIWVKMGRVCFWRTPSESIRYCSCKKWQINLGDAGAIDRLGLTFQYQIYLFFIEKNGPKRLQIKNCKYYMNA